MGKSTNITTTVTFDEERLTTLNVYLSQQNLYLVTMLTEVASQKTDDPNPIKKDKKAKTFDEQEQTLAQNEPVQNV